VIAAGGEPAPGHPEIVRITAPNPGPMTLDGTNTYVVAAAEGGYVIDPGPDDAEHLERVRKAAGEAGGIAGVLLTHGHSDHSAGVEPLGAELLWGRASGESEMEGLAKALAAGSVDPLDELSPPLGNNSSREARVGPFAVLPTPGHAADHVCFLIGDVCFCGDLILGTGSSIVPPAAGGGSLTAYLSSLAALDRLDLELLAPGHGPWIIDPAAKIAEYRDHRLDRERRLIVALDQGERSRAALLAQVWDDVPEQLRPAAAIAMQAHVEKLAAEGRLAADELVD
jgi:glyoxylase-like metal-dependent hydrolase (beta-lactamase superfamily II)